MRVAGTAVFLTARTDVVPGALLHNLKHNKVLHERVVIARCMVDDTPFVPPRKRIEVEKLGKGFFAVRIHHGFFETPDVPQARCQARPYGLAVDLETTTFFIGRETLVPAEHPAARPLAHLALYAAGVERAVAGAVLSPAAQSRGRTGHAGYDLGRLFNLHADRVSYLPANIGRGSMRRIVVGIVCALLGLSASAFAQQSVPLSITQGALVGPQDDGIASSRTFPLPRRHGPLRWRATQPGPSWQGVRAADSYGPVCPQPRYCTHEPCRKAKIVFRSTYGHPIRTPNCRSWCGSMAARS